MQGETRVQIRLVVVAVSVMGFLVLCTLLYEHDPRWIAAIFIAIPLLILGGVWASRASSARKKG